MMHDPSQSAEPLPRYIGRDISWLRFNERVLALAEDPQLPLLERVRFLSIFTSNLDEFYMKRFALMWRRLRSGVEVSSADGMTVRQQLDTLRERVESLQETQARFWYDDIKPELLAHGIEIVEYASLSAPDRERVDAWFRDNVFPVLTPLSVDPGHRFPFISNLSENLGVLLSADPESERQFARLKIPDPVPRLVSVPESGEIGTVPDPTNVRLVPQEQVIINNLHEVFPGMHIAEVMPFRVTRSASGDAEDLEGFETLLEHVEAELKQRRFADPVRIETGPDPSSGIMDLLLEELDLTPEHVYHRRGPMEYADLLELLSLDRPDLKLPRWRPVMPRRLRDETSDVFAAIRERDILVHHPYESFRNSVERFIAEAADDPNVLAIKQTLYRTSRDSPFIDSLIRAADAGKAVACLVELRARFDEDRNVRFARQLEDHGVHVAYGVLGLKTHCKCSLVVRREGSGLRRYAHIGTGNYHPDTAQLYTDLGLLTCDPELTEDVMDVFNVLTGRSRKGTYNRLLVAPHGLRSGFLEMIDQEMAHARAGRPARIVGKMNQLEDLKIVDKLYEASQAGVEVTLNVRGFCSLRPGVPGLSENIRVISIVGRFLEHARMFHFSGGYEDPVDGAWLLGSADWMHRNLDERVEVVTPVDDREARRSMHRALQVNLQDRKRAWELQPDGTYRKLEPDGTEAPDSPAVLGTFEVLCAEAIATLREDGTAV
ncbi:MAG: polyphosphate kinase 1 [Planctomycetota bacterium]